jgi:hypothetical protein
MSLFATFFGQLYKPAIYIDLNGTSKFGYSDDLNSVADEVLTCRKIKKAIASGIIDPLKIAEVVGVPVCLLVKTPHLWPGMDSIAVENIQLQLKKHRELQSREIHLQNLANKKAEAAT